jgi:hypothetical protein
MSRGGRERGVGTGHRRADFWVHGGSGGANPGPKIKVRLALRLGGYYVCSFEPSRRAGNESVWEQREHWLLPIFRFPKKLVWLRFASWSCSVQHLPVCRWRTRTRLPVNTQDQRSSAQPWCFYACRSCVAPAILSAALPAHAHAHEHGHRDGHARAWRLLLRPRAALPPDWESHQDGGNCVTPRSTAPCSSAS